MILGVLKHIQGKLTILFLDWNGNTCPIFQTQVYILKSLIQSINTLKHLLSVLLTKHLPHSVTNIHVVYTNVRFFSLIRIFVLYNLLSPHTSYGIKSYFRM